MIKETVVFGVEEWLKLAYMAVHIQVCAQRTQKVALKVSHAGLVPRFPAILPGADGCFGVDWEWRDSGAD
jgi:hypothetical protein